MEAECRITGVPYEISALLPKTCSVFWIGHSTVMKGRSSYNRRVNRVVTIREKQSRQ